MKYEMLESRGDFFIITAAMTDRVKEPQDTRVYYVEKVRRKLSRISLQRAGCSNTGRSQRRECGPE